MATTTNLTNRPISTRVRPLLIGTPLGLALLGGFRHRDATDAAPSHETAPAVQPPQFAPRGFNPGDIAQARGVRPVAIAAEAAGFDAEIEYIHIVDGVMENPTGPDYVSWYEESSELGEVGNALFAAHVDWHTVGPAIFYNLRNLTEGDQIDVTGEDGNIYTYAVTWLETVALEDLTEERVQELVGQTEIESITLLTCGGEFDYATGHYLARIVARAERLRTEKPRKTQ